MKIKVKEVHMNDEQAFSGAIMAFAEVAVALAFVLAVNFWVNKVVTAYENVHKTGVSSYDATKACQTIAATHTDPTWDYKACINALKDSLQPQGVISKV